MAQTVHTLRIHLQENGNGALYADWFFDDPKSATKTDTFAVGDLVEVKRFENGPTGEQARWYNGSTISEWVYGADFYITQLGYGSNSNKKDRAVLGADSTGEYNIRSPINIKFLSLVKSTSEGSTDVDTLDHFEVEWEYNTGGSAWFSGSSSTIDADENVLGTDGRGQHVHSEPYSPPDNATSVRVRVKPVAKTKKSGNSDVEYWTGDYINATYDLLEKYPPELSGSYSVDAESLTQYKLKVSIINVDDPRTDAVQFKVYNGTAVSATSPECHVVETQASWERSLSPGGEYYVSYRAAHQYYETKWIYSDWSDLQGPYITVPDTPKAITSCSAVSKNSVKLKWNAVTSADSYTIEYTEDKTLFDVSDKPTKKEGIKTTEFVISDLASGEEYFFRLRAVNSSGESAWTDMVSVVLGTKPEAPTTWSSATTAIVGEDLVLYWVHNAEDNSDQTFAQIELTVGGVTKTLDYPVNEDDDEDDEQPITSYPLNTSAYPAGTKIQWRVCTAGITQEVGEWSISRTIDIYAPPELVLYIDDVKSATVSSFPIFIKALVGPASQTPTGYYLSITADTAHETTDNFGNLKYISAGEQIYSRYINSTTSVLSHYLMPQMIRLEDGQTYTVTCTVSMNSGLTAEATATMTTDFDGSAPNPYASVFIKKETYQAIIRPFCGNENVTMSVYRREYDGSFTEIETNLTSNSTTILDPHPALDFARYRIVATDLETSRVGYSDIPGQPVGGKEVIMQWDEAWTNFDEWSDTVYAQPAWNGSMLRLPYNIDVSEATSIDVAFVNYIGRAHPVNYYGTQLGETAQWSVDVPKSDKDTIYALRRLAKWKGSVYVREPSGVGYWAHVKVSFSQKHADPVVPVSLDITRVEGGV